MSTRSEFFIGDGNDAEWLGSMFMNGYWWNSAIERALVQQTEASFRERVNELMDDYNPERERLNMPLEHLDYHYHFMPATNEILIYNYGEDKPYIYGSDKWKDFVKAY